MQVRLGSVKENPNQPRATRSRAPAPAFIRRAAVHPHTPFHRHRTYANPKAKLLVAVLLQMHGREECVQLLLRRGARHDTVSIGGHTVLHLASANRHSEVVKRLVDAGARVNVRNAHGNTPLHSAAATGTVDVLSVSCSSRIVGSVQHGKLSDTRNSS